MQEPEEVLYKNINIEGSSSGSSSSSHIIKTEETNIIDMDLGQKESKVINIDLGHPEPKTINMDLGSASSSTIDIDGKSTETKKIVTKEIVLEPAVHHVSHETKSSQIR